MAEKEYIERETARAQLIINDELHAADIIKSIPAANVRPVVKASWQYKTLTVPGGKGQTYAKWRCTACKGKAKERTNFCPNCGADMREEADV